MTTPIISDAALGYKLSMLHEDVGDMKVALKELAIAITRFAIVEERQAQTGLALERAFKTLEKVEARVTAEESASASINNALQTHLVAIRDLQVKIDTHIKVFEESKDQHQAMLNKGLGAWKILAWVLAGAQAIIIAGAISLRADLLEIHGSIQGLEQSDVRIIQRMNSEEKK